MEVNKGRISFYNKTNFRTINRAKFFFITRKIARVKRGKQGKRRSDEKKAAKDIF